MTENFESMGRSRSYVFSMWGKSIKVAVLLAFFFCGSGLTGLEQKDICCAYLLWQLGHGVWLREIFHYQGKYREVFYREDVVF